MSGLLTAEEARAKYNEDKVKAEDYIKSVVEPMIRQVYQDSHKIYVKTEEMWCVGHKISGLEDYNSTRVTEKVESILKDLGYHIEHTVESSGDEYRNGSGTLIISWGE